MRRPGAAAGEAEADGLERLASRIVERLAGAGLVRPAVAVEAFAEQVALAVVRQLSSPREELTPENTDVGKALAEADEETGGRDRSPQRT